MFHSIQIYSAFWGREKITRRLERQRIVKNMKRHGQPNTMKQNNWVETERIKFHHYLSVLFAVHGLQWTLDWSQMRFSAKKFLFYEFMLQTSGWEFSELEKKSLSIFKLQTGFSSWVCFRPGYLSVDCVPQSEAAHTRKIFRFFFSFGALQLAVFFRENFNDLIRIFWNDKKLWKKTNTKFN